MTRQSSDGQVAKAIIDLGWTGESPEFGSEPGHMLERTIVTGQFILALMQATTISRIDVKIEAGAECFTIAQ